MSDYRGLRAAGSELPAFTFLWIASELGAFRQLGCRRLLVSGFVFPAQQN